MGSLATPSLPGTMSYPLSQSRTPPGAFRYWNWALPEVPDIWEVGPVTLK